MLIGTHFAIGAAVYRLAEGKPWWVKVPAVIIGGFFSHYMLDSICTYHRLRGDEWSFLYCLIQIIAVWFIWFSALFQSKHRWDLFFPPMVLAGGWAIISWDWERLIHKNYIHFAFNVFPRYFTDCSSNPWTGMWEVLLIVGLAILLWRKCKC